MDIELAKEMKNSKLDPYIYQIAFRMVDTIDRDCFDSIYIHKKNFNKTYDLCFFRLKALKNCSMTMTRFSNDMRNLLKISMVLSNLLKRKGYEVDDTDINFINASNIEAEEFQKNTGIRSKDLSACQFKMPFNFVISMKVY